MAAIESFPKPVQEILQTLVWDNLAPFGLPDDQFRDFVTRFFAAVFEKNREVRQSFRLDLASVPSEEKKSGYAATLLYQGIWRMSDEGAKSRLLADVERPTGYLRTFAPEKTCQTFLDTLKRIAKCRVYTSADYVRDA